VPSRGEDWIFATPVASQQIMTLSIDALRSGLQWAAAPAAFPLNTPQATPVVQTEARAAAGRPPTPKWHFEFMMYVMKHFPGNTNNSWKRQLFGDLAHGLSFVNLFDLETSFSGYTCDYVDADGGAYPAVREGLNLLGTFEDIVQRGAVQAQGAAAALLYSETADAWYDGVGPTSASFASGLRSLYLALRHAELPVDVVIEPDAAAGRLRHYAALYVVYPHMTTACAAAVAGWVGTGGRVFATASAGLLNETNQTNVPFAALLGVAQSGIWAGGRAGLTPSPSDTAQLLATAGWSLVLAAPPVITCTS
jgi:hypothetical protein